MINFEQFKSVRGLTEELSENLETEDFVIQASEEVSPTKWHLAHTTWFFETFVLKELDPEYSEFHPDFNFLFNSYYNGKGDRTQRDHRGLMTRPTVREVFAYRDHVNRGVERFFQKTEINQKIHDLMVLGLNHEQQHQELLLTDLKYNLSLNPLFPVVLDCNEYKVQDAEGWVKMTEGLYEIGFEGDGFSYDNEHGRHKVFLEPFEISKSLVTNREFLEFMEAGGYEDHNFWHSEGWDWLNKHEFDKPLYWHKQNDQFFYYTLNGLKPIEWDAPVAHISFYEAAAYAAWKGCRLPTEFEWEAASDQFDWGQRWEWTSSAYLPYPRYAKAPGAIGEYNGKFMVNQMVLRGASIATSPNHSRKTYRNFFSTPSRWQFSGIRLAK
ncbi:ergothioneine biosynthesis protein EgtB [Litoribacter ruber]|uniref:Ergothioneine biosynthesis protein EgtB n=1 Tax=Litoribacter ruber TaxID=702568 RepID=A0AAP2CJ04_9BACT|nr:MULTISPECIES: ergothioneine biosynthesis protein EgtB [Litoribacter]MBS9525062.1 ergothioneine biosynthesis protein EgtB [Litoribacter alkaliphilus]MBT0811759.1 ergothioneine biosynthesis protein EgtB [Litoribacter ruber]